MPNLVIVLTIGILAAAARYFVPSEPDPDPVVTARVLAANRHVGPL
jgi:hypothetical protein